MKFLIQKVKGKIVHDFSFTLLKSVEFRNWLKNGNHIKIKYLNTIIDDSGNAVCSFEFKPYHEKYVPVGSVEFVTAFLQHFYNLTPKPLNIPERLIGLPFTKREVHNGNHMDFENVMGGKYFVKSNDKIKGFAEMIELKEPGMLPIPAGNYQVSEYISIDSEWRAFVYKGKLVGLQNYCGDFTKFPNVSFIKYMIDVYSKDSAPIAYTLDIGLCDEHTYGGDVGTFIIECHDFFSCGLYGFSDYAIYPQMLYKWFWEYIQRKMVEQKRETI